MRKESQRVQSETKPADDPITPKEYGGLQAAFSFLNTRLFDGKLPNVVIVLQRRAHSGGHYSPSRFSSRVGSQGYDELSLNPDGFIGKTDEFIVSILLHEMDHHWQDKFGKPAARGYHNKEWAAKMKSQGLMPSNSGMVGGKETGQQMSHYIIPGGHFTQAFAELAATGWKLNLQSTIYAGGSKRPSDSKTKFTCASCDQNAWGKPDLAIRCDLCNARMLPERAADQSHDQNVAA